MSIDFSDELIIAKKAAKKAGLFLKKNKPTLNKVISSTHKDIKLKADLEAENIIKEIISSDSNIPMLAEESGMSTDVLLDYLWVIDPLDGTANYARDIPICCVSIALVSGLKPLLGVIYDFNNDALYEGSVGSQAACNEKDINVSNISSPADGILVTGLPNNTDYSDHAMKKMIKNFQSWKKIRMIGSAAIASTYVASGKAEAYCESRTYLWDVAAGAAIVNAAGGRANIKNKNDKFQVDVMFTNSSLKA